MRWNKKWEEVTGYSPQELATMYGADFFEGADRDLVTERIRAVFRDGAAEVEAECVRCSPCQILSHVASLMRVRANAKNLPLRIDYDGPIPETILSDPTRRGSDKSSSTSPETRSSSPNSARSASRPDCSTPAPIGPGCSSRWPTRASG